MEAMDGLSVQDKLNLIRQRFKTTKDLWIYTTERRKLKRFISIIKCFLVGYLMPSLKNCRLQHIQDVLSNRKKHLLLQNCSAKKVPSWPELSVKNCYQQVIQQYPAVLEYLPDPHGKEQKLPERDFFWTVMFTLCNDDVENYIR